MERLVRIKSRDGQVLEVPEAVATRSRVIKDMRELVQDDHDIPIPLATAEILKAVFKYCAEHAEFEANGDRTERDLAAAKLELKHFDEAFIDVSVDTLYDIAIAANFLAIEDLLNTCCKKIASMIEGKGVEEIRKLFNVENDFTPEEEEEIREENRWAY